MPNTNPPTAHEVALALRTWLLTVRDRANADQWHATRPSSVTVLLDHERNGDELTGTAFRMFFGKDRFLIHVEIESD